jgi:YHS domain-containing protein
MRQNSIRWKSALAVLVLSCATTAFAGKVDPVYQQAGPVKGSAQFSYEWQGATWLFSSAENRDRFNAEPDRYAPQYGGFCAYAVSKGRTASIDPEAWKIVDGKLYLNYSKGVQKKCRTWQGISRRATETGPI